MYKLTLQLELTKECTPEVAQKIADVLVGVSKGLENAGRSFEFTHKTDGNNFQAELTSESHTASDALIHIDKHVRQVLGKDLKMSIKEFTILHYELEAPLEQMPTKEIHVPLTSAATFENNKVKLVYERIPFNWIQQHYIERTLKLITDKIRMQAYEFCL